MTLEFWYTALLVSMLAAAGLVAVYGDYRLLKDGAGRPSPGRKRPRGFVGAEAPPRSDQAEAPWVR